jgi:S-DNA-T family DNA segregation ATPase FtsK/SpoIIIE
LPGLPRPWGEFLGIALLAIGVLMVGGLCSYQFGTGNLMGPVGGLVASALYATLGMGAYLLVLGVLGLGIKALLGETMEIRAGEGLGFAGATIAGCVLLHVTFPEYRTHGLTAGGLTGELLGEVGLGLFDSAGTYLIAIALLCVGLFASTPLSVAHLVLAARAVVRGTVALAAYLWGGLLGIIDGLRGRGDADEARAAEDETSTRRRGRGARGGRGGGRRGGAEAEARAQASPPRPRPPSPPRRRRRSPPPRPSRARIASSRAPRRTCRRSSSPPPRQRARRRAGQARAPKKRKSETKAVEAVEDEARGGREHVAPKRRRKPDAAAPPPPRR